MRKKSMLRLAGAVMAVTMMFSAISVTSMAAPKRRTYTAPVVSVSEADALAIAYADAGVNAADATLIKNRLDYDDWRPEYEIDFYAGNYKYEYEIDATSGRILDRERKYSKKYAPQPAPAPAPVDPAPAPVDPAPAPAYISADEALNIALANAGLSASNVRVTENQFKNKRYGAIYEIEFRAGRFEYEYDIDATSGVILKKEIDD